MTQMSRLRPGADRKGVLVLVAEGDLLPADAKPTLYFVLTLFGFAAAVTPDLDPEFADVGGLTGVRGLTDVPAAIARFTRCRRFLAHGGCGGLLGFLNRRFGNDRLLGGILAVSRLGGRIG